ncbi:YbaN family protein [Pseudothioclava arenosa]|uniref:DUF454 domain-containing protein n=1 Tax=Pseudothioclava arenosa TaxID=1795308 RepID=A0A2A4CN24_9RHOB|nr:YbaN family protein [Pseudothioclava arenosa]PCD76651.1 hypothetical protein CLN94_08635 [Pseudothioclava arenosa]
MRIIWLICGLISLGLGIVGAFVPLLPTVPLVLLAAFFFARSSERLHQWLLNHPQFGPAIADWSERGAISKRGKWAATVSILATFAITLFLGIGWKIILIQAAALGAVSLFIWTRPSV